MKTFYYIGSFPPPYGGVTVKNDLLYFSLKKALDDSIVKADTQLAKRNLFQLAKQSTILLSRKHPVIIATAGKQRRNISLFLYCCNKDLLRKSALIVMGGIFHNVIQGDIPYLRALGTYKAIFVETKGMLESMKKLGLKNVYLYPNCRNMPQTLRTAVQNRDDKLRCVYFSLISREKGADLVLEAAKQLPHVQFDFYGVLEAGYKEKFLQEMQSAPNAVYHGVFQVKGDNVYEKLNEYDLLLLPTSWPHEGVPGVLVEAKIAAVPAIVSNVCYNAEIVEDGISGIVLRENTVEVLTEAIAGYDRDRDLLHRHKEGALRSAEGYFIENYLDDIAKVLDS